MALSNSEHRKQAFKAFSAGMNPTQLYRSKQIPAARATLYRWYAQWRKQKAAPKAPRRSSALPKRPEAA